MFHYLLIANDAELGPVPYSFAEESKARDFAIYHRDKLPHLTFALFRFQDDVENGRYIPIPF